MKDSAQKFGSSRDDSVKVTESLLWHERSLSRNENHSRSTQCQLQLFRDYLTYYLCVLLQIVKKEKKNPHRKHDHFPLVTILKGSFQWHAQGITGDIFEKVGLLRLKFKSNKGSLWLLRPTDAVLSTLGFLKIVWKFSVDDTGCIYTNLAVQQILQIGSCLMF